MADTTLNYGLPYPEGRDGVVVHTDLERLAKGVDRALTTDIIHDVNAAVGDLPPRLQQVERKTDPIIKGSNRVWSVQDQTGATAIEVDDQGRTHIYDLATGGGGSGATITQWHVFLAAGQSNMVGPGEKSPWDDHHDPRLLQFGSHSRELTPATVPLDMHEPTHTRGISPATTFARNYLKNMPHHVGVILVPAAHGGTTLTTDTDKLTWLPGAATDPSLDLYGKSVEQTLGALDAAGDQAHLKGILWHQGEGNNEDKAGFIPLMDQLITAYRADLGDADLPIIVGQMQRESLDQYPMRAQRDHANSEIPARHERTAFAPLSHGVCRYQDITHLSRLGVEMMGDSFFQAYQSALRNVEDALPMPPTGVTATRSGDRITVEWHQPPCRVTGYRIEYALHSGSWTTVTREHPMQLHETFTVPAEGVRVRIVTEANDLDSQPYPIRL